MSAKKYFDKRNPKGEVAEWKAELTDKHRQKDALKKIIAAMTIGKDVSAVFAEVTSCGQTTDLELKKLVYLYLINYAKTQPELAIMAVNTFVKDSNDTNPMLRALAIRTMGCIRVDRITEYLCDPLEKCLKDQDPYVRKTAAICVAKLYDMSPELVADRGFLDMLRDMTADANPMVVSNAVAALAEIRDMGGAPEALAFSRSTASYLLSAMEQCTEWGQVYILESLAEQAAEGPEEAEAVLSRVASRLQHANSAVVLAAVKVVLAHLDVLPPDGVARGDYLRKMAAPLVTLLSQRPEVQYVALRNINLILQKHPDVLAAEARVFFCKYNDPIYVKLEKLEIMAALATEATIAGVLAELKEYAQEVDVDFVRKAVRCIGRIALRLPGAAARCVEALIELVRLRVAYVVQEAVIVVRDIFRCYPGKYEAVISDLCAALETLEEPEAKAAMVWILGEHADRIDNAGELLGLLLDAFLDEPTAVQLQLLSAAVKLFLKKPAAEGAQGMISSVLTAATQQTDNPDLRDRAFMYWRMLASMPEDAQKVVLAEKPPIRDTTMQLPADVRDALLAHLASLASVYHKLPHTFVRRQRPAVERAVDLEVRRAAAEAEADGATPSADVGNGGGGAAGSSGASAGLSGTASGDAAAASVDAAATAAHLPPPPLDLLGGLDDSAPVVATSAQQGSAASDGVDDLLGGLTSVSVSDVAAGPADPFGPEVLGGSASPPATALPLLAESSVGHGCTIHGRLVAEAGSFAYKFMLTNHTDAPMSGFHVQFNRNRLGVGAPVGNTGLPVGPLPPGGTVSLVKPLAVLTEKVAPEQGATLQIALKWAELSVPFVMLQDEIPHELGAVSEPVDPMAGLL